MAANEWFCCCKGVSGAAAKETDKGVAGRGPTGTELDIGAGTLTLVGLGGLPGMNTPSPGPEGLSASRGARQA